MQKDHCVLTQWDVFARHCINVAWNTKHLSLLKASLCFLFTCEWVCVLENHIWRSLIWDKKAPDLYNAVPPSCWSSPNPTYARADAVKRDCTGLESLSFPSEMPNLRCGLTIQVDTGHENNSASSLLVTSINAKFWATQCTAFPGDRPMISFALPVGFWGFFLMLFLSAIHFRLKNNNHAISQEIRLSKMGTQSSMV